MNYRTTHAFNSLRDIVDNIAYRTKYASDGYDSGMPDDPTGDGFREPVTGSQFTEYSDDYSNTNPFTPNVGEGGEPSLTVENQQENSNSDFDIYVSGDGPDGQDECKTTKDDPGTNMPAEAGEEKYSAYLNYSMEENIDGFNKCAGLWLTMYQDNLEKQAGYMVMNASEFPFTKQAYDNNLPEEVVAEVAALESLPLNLREKLASLSNYELANVMEQAKAILDNEENVKVASANVTGGLSVDDYTSLHNMDVQSLIKMAEDAGEAADEIAAATEEETAPDEEELEALEELSPEDIELLDSLEPEELEALVEDAADASDDLAADAGVEDPEDAAALEELADEEGDDEAAEEDSEVDPEIMDEAAAVESLPEETVDKLASLSPHALRMYMQKLAEDIEALEQMPDDAPVDDIPAEDVPSEEELGGGEEAGDEEEAIIEELLDELPPDVADALVEMSPEELQEVIDAAEDMGPEEGAEGEGDLVDEEEAPELLSQMADETGGDEETALNDLSSAMTEEDVTPEELAEMGKEGSWHFQRELVKLAAAVKAYRDAGLYRYTRPRTTKEAYARAQMHSFLNEIR